jgi:hypothetical protein
VEDINTMNFDVDRLSRLAGIPDRGSRVLNEASTRSMHDDNGLSGEGDYRFGKNQLNEMEALEKHLQELGDDDKAHEGDAPIDEGGAEGPDGEMEEMGDVVLEIDEGMLRQEIRRMRKERLDENRLRTAIRGEIQSIFSDLGIESDSSWVYGDNQPKNSREGSVNMGFPGIGFK